MKVKWLGHAAFLITSDEGVRIVTDPYQPGVYGLEYGSIKDKADIVLVSHEHDDHNYVAGVPGNPQVIRGAGSHQANGIDFKGIACYHDESGGKERGENTIFCFTVNGVKLCHLGDLGHDLDTDRVNAIGDVDVLMIPVGGSFTIDASGADRVITHAESAGNLMSLSLLSANVGAMIEDLMNTGKGLEVVERPITRAELGRAPADIQDEGDLVLAVVRGDEVIRFDSGSVRVFQPGDRIVVIRKAKRDEPPPGVAEAQAGRGARPPR